MKYLVMECHPAYAVVLTEDGCFLKAANMHYEVGQTVTEIIQLHLPEIQPVKKKGRPWLKTLGTLAACLAIAVTSLVYRNMMPYASVYMSINPEVRIDVNRKDRVLQVEGVNEDGTNLIADYSHKGKELDLVMDELVDLAIDQGYLHEGGEITLSLDADEKWTQNHESHLNEHLNAHLAEKIAVTIDVERKDATPAETEPKQEIQPVVIPISPDVYGDSDYGEDREEADDRDDENDRDDGDGDSGYRKPSSTAPKDDGDTDYDRQEDEGTDYEKPVKTTTAVKEEGESDYDEPEAAEEGESVYDTSSKTTSAVKKEAQTDYDPPEKEEQKESDYDPPEKEEQAESDYASDDADDEEEDNGDDEEEEDEDASSDYEKN